MPIGCQTYPVRKMIAKDFPGTIKQLAEAGFQTIELCSPVGYADSGFAGLAKYKGRRAAQNAGRSGSQVRELSLRYQRNCGRTWRAELRGQTISA
jgi:hypothetical protein